MEQFKIGDFLDSDENYLDSRGYYDYESNTEICNDAPEGAHYVIIRTYVEYGDGIEEQVENITIDLLKWRESTLPNSFR